MFIDNRGGFMKNKKGQSLVEFVLILPVMLIIIFCMIDFGRVMSLKSDLDGVCFDAITFYQNGKDKDEILSILTKNEMKDINLNIEVKDDYVVISVSKKINPITPGLTYIKKDVFNVTESRVIKNE